jgi:predicted AlkP superfamily phosphohydrolase/phosphomutase
MIVSDHGFGRYEKNFYLNKVLEEHGLLFRERSAKKVASRGLSTRKVIDAARKLDVLGLEGRVPHRFREKLARGIDSALAVPIDMDRTLAYAAARSAESVFIADHVPASQRDEVASRVIEALEAARDPESGEPIIDRALRREDVYDGSELHRIPDILIDFGERPYVASDRLAASSIVERLPASGGGGRHRRYGILLALGPGIGGGEIEGANIVDLAPTALHAMGLPVPDDMDGRVLTELFSDGRVIASAGAASSDSSEVVYTPEEEAAIQASLENLGYM